LASRKPVRFKGDWVAVNRYIRSGADGRFIHTASTELAELAKWILYRVRDHITMQSLPWAELAESTKYKKESSLVYLDRKKFIRNIALQFKQTKTTALFRIGPTKGRHRKGKGGVTYQELAKYLEFGYTHKRGKKQRHVPARPLFRPVFDEAKKSSRLKDILKKVTVEW
jgi:hypothetical protein